MATTTGKGFTVRGVHFASPAEARASARRLREDGDQAARAFRARGQEAEAERISDQAHEAADAYDTAAAEHESDTTGVTPRPRKPAARSSSSTPASSSTRRPTSKRPAARTSPRRAARPVTRPVTRAVTGSSLWDIAGTVALATLGIAFLTLVIATPRGPSAWSWLVGKLAGAVELVAGTGDPLAGLGGVPAGDPAAARSAGAAIAHAAAAPRASNGQAAGLGPKHPTSTVRK